MRKANQRKFGVYKQSFTDNNSPIRSTGSNYGEGQQMQDLVNLQNQMQELMLENGGDLKSMDVSLRNQNIIDLNQTIEEYIKIQRE